MNFIEKLTNWYFSQNALPYWSVLILDCLICYFSGIFVFWLYYHGAVTLGNIGVLSKTIFVYMIFNLIGFKVFRTYSGIFRYSSFVDLQRVASAMALSCIIAEIVHYLIYPMHQSWRFVPLQGRQILAMYVVATILMWAVRVLVKTLYDVSFSSDKGKRTLIYGVRDGGVGLAKNIRNEKPARFQLNGFVTHESDYQNHILMGVKVYQVNSNLKDLIREKHITAFLVSPLQNEVFRKDTALQDILIDAGVKIYMSSESKEWSADDDFSATKLKEISIDDLLPRNEIQINLEQVGKMIEGTKVLITGSAGSIGNEILKQVATFKPSELVLIDIAETPQNDVKIMMEKNFPEIKTHVVVGSITNQERMERIFEDFRPDYVFHAAAYKHVPLMEENPSESVQNNVYGTKVVADLSAKYGVKKFVMLSTDKAVNPTNVMGCSKRICEIYVQSLDAAIKRQAQGASSTTQFVTTRFGNVLGSNGSVIPLFKQQIQAGGPVTVTDPDIIRYFMLIPEACKLVLEAGTQGHGGEIFVFDMGTPVRIAELAKRMISLSGAHGVEIKYTGLRPGEKLYEEVLSDEENTIESFHEKIRIANVRKYDYDTVSKQIDELIALSKTYDDMAIVKKMKDIVPEYISNNSVFGALDRLD
ncbi:nucleoside-diphosphate sugar epimerase/dehydratase [Prevotella sp. Rep29]|uniref:polysaccharide biosynthesis protein n=1 Tax=Prevotella sp. Rep29 TaxID=2691580 RepID=UPI001C6EA11E|nr:nucleoside-diphosphate sugar epimerase/dehydratase [Prevotella sp. Rep29]QYR10328.1 polysaccharide biosynthesis protein [Prevotella sp. Rep29]